VDAKRRSKKSTRASSSPALSATSAPPHAIGSLNVLTEAKKVVRECGTTGHLPFLHAELAELAQLDGDNEGYDHELREAQQLFDETGARAHAAKVAKLAALAA
jgi:hypothetical protein